ncbi:MAG TPA: hypothetical protein VFB54_15675 [Burkholderiales bacterium]|nr:hypothetical protein [Burkholderiales bacterium]
MPAQARRGPARKASSRFPWWLSGGTEDCAHCGLSYVYEAEVRCVDCDDGICPACVAWVERRAYCSGCAPDTKQHGRKRKATR